jgi:2-polyprenyl-6-methoxyphenol hydroxylase-like FAD-dependent oxidoreductase
MLKYLLCFILVPYFALAADPDIAFVGAGPIGLYTAIQAKIHYPEARIHFYEKYKEYQRKHSVRIEQHSFHNAVKDKQFRAYLKGLGKSVRTSDLERYLLQIARDKDITIEYRKIENIDEIKKQYPGVKVIVGSDGSHSMVRESLFPQSDLKTNDLSYTAEIKYEVIGETRELSIWTEVPQAMLKASHSVMEYVGRPSKIKKEGEEEVVKTTVAIRIFISKEEYEALKPHATFKDPIYLYSEKKDPAKVMPKDLYQTAIVWLRKRHELTQENVDQASVKLTVTNLPEYYSPKVYVEKNGVHYFLVGDAAFGVPFFRSINNGFESGNVLARVLAKLLKPEMKFEKVLNPKVDTASTAPLNKVNLIHWVKQSTPEEYERFVLGQQDREKILAFWKSQALQIWDSSVGTTQFFYHSKESAVIKVSEGSKMPSEASKEVEAPMRAAPAEDDLTLERVPTSRKDSKKESCMGSSTSNCTLF